MSPRAKKRALDVTKMVALASAVLFAGQQWVSIRGEMAKQVAADSAQVRSIARMRSEYATAVGLINRVPTLDRRLRRVERHLRFTVADGPPMPSDTLAVRPRAGIVGTALGLAAAPLRWLGLIGG
jgi:hypothetical protein